MLEIENREDKLASENAKTLQQMFNSKMKSMKEQKWKKTKYCMASIQGSKDP